MKRDEAYVWLDSWQNGNAHEVKPGRIGLIMDDLKRSVCPMGGDIKPFHEPFRMQRCLMFASVNVDLRLGKITEAAGMVDVEMGHHDVGDVIG